MQPDEEIVAVYDAAGAVVAAAPRTRVYREGLWHGGTGVMVRSGDGERVYVHRRSPTKMVFPGRYDCWAGGVIAPGETPLGCAERELAEELGITGVRLEPCGAWDFEGVSPADGAVLRCHNFLFEARWDGPVTHQPEEVVWGGWVPLADLPAMLDDEQRWPFVPDGRLGALRWLAATR